ncbi:MULTISPECIES: hypothetical protein [unclassified Mesorhizobium]|uniref:hypothetical protein n=1 Tax=unclassified Mesorhizobium TaxID=325217 RepID=UPI0015E45318|nr:MULTISPECIES: hypothetical protein [unclassified Mesorhizobium]
MKNWRNSVHDVGPPLHHDDPRHRFTKIGFGGVAIVIGPGPFAVPAPSVYVKETPSE